MEGDSSYNHGGMALIHALERLIKKGGAGAGVVRSDVAPADTNCIWAKVVNGMFLGLFVHDGSGWEMILDNNYFTGKYASENDGVQGSITQIYRSAGGNVSIAELAGVKVSQVIGKTTIITGIQHGFDATKIIATGMNLFDYTGASELTTILNGKKLAVNGNDCTLADDSSMSVAIVKSIATISGQGENNGFVIKVFEDNFDENSLVVGWANSANATTFEKVKKDTNYNSQSYCKKNSNNNLLPQGYIAISCPTASLEHLSMHIAWSGYNDNKFEAFTQSVLEIPQIVGGYVSVGSIYNECNFDLQKIIQRLAVVDLGTLTFEKEYENNVFVGFKSSSLATLIKLSTANLQNDTIESTTQFTCDGNGDIHFATADESLSFAGKQLVYELASPIETAFEKEGLYIVGDFGVEWLYDAQFEPQDILLKYGVNYRDALRNYAVSGAIFTEAGFLNPNLYLGNIRTLANFTPRITELARFMIVNLTANKTLTLPTSDLSASISFSVQMVVKASGAYTLTINSENGTMVYNLSQATMTGASGKRCYVTLLWDGTNWAFTASEWF